MPERPDPEPCGRRSAGEPPPLSTLIGGEWGDGSGKLILVVDDERHIVRLVEVNLQRAGYVVIKAYDGREALEKARSENPDLVVLDVMMPDMDGLAVLKNLKADAATAHIPVILLTAKALDADVFPGWRSGLDCNLSKPFKPMDLLDLIRRWFK